MGATEYQTPNFAVERIERYFADTCSVQFVLICVIGNLAVLTSDPKTVEVARLQVGNATRSIKIVVSTIVEAEQFTDWLLEAKSEGKTINVCSRPSKTHILLRGSDLMLCRCSTAYPYLHLRLVDSVY